MGEELDQLDCSKCGVTYVTLALKADEFRFSAICDSCRPKPKESSFKIGSPFIKNQKG